MQPYLVERGAGPPYHLLPLQTRAWDDPVQRRPLALGTPALLHGLPG